MSINHKFRYDTIKIPEVVTKMIDDIIIEADGFFASRTDVIKYALLEFVDKRKRDRREEIERQNAIRREGLERCNYGCQGTGETRAVDSGNPYCNSGESGERIGKDNFSNADN